MQSNQRGGIVSYIVVALALVGLLASGLYLSKTQAREARNGAGSSGQVAVDAPKEGAKTPESDKSKEQAAPSKAAPTPSRDSAAAPTAKPTPAAPADRVASTGPSSDIPETGPSDVLMYTVGVSALVFTSYQLVQSRRLVRENALKR